MNTVPVTFLGGFSAWRGLLGVITYPDMLSGTRTTFCRFFTCNDGAWGRGRDDWNFDCVSITYLIREAEGYKAWWLLGKNGEAVEIRAGVPAVEQIPGAGLNVERPYGYLSEIKAIDGELYVCGEGRQVYVRTSGAWASLSNEILSRETAVGFFDLDGLNRQGLYAVGWHGGIFFYDGRTWRRDDSPTNAHLAAVRCLGEKDVWICGDKGIVLHGSFNRWQVIQDQAFSGNWYCIEEFGGAIYLAGNGQLARIDGDKIVGVDVGLGRPITTHRLHSRDGLLWSVGEKDILVFDGQSWKAVVHPDNV